MDKNYEIYKASSDGTLEITRVKDKDTDGYVIGANKELVDAMLCEVKWEVKKLELEIKKYKVILFLENDQGEDGKKEDELKMELLREQALCREFIKGLDRIMFKIKDLCNDKSRHNNREEIVKKVDSLRAERELLKDILIRQMTTYSVLKSLHNERRIGLISNLSRSLTNKQNKNNYEVEEDILNYFDVFPSRNINNGPENSSKTQLNKAQK